MKLTCQQAARSLTFRSRLQRLALTFHLFCSWSIQTSVGFLQHLIESNNMQTTTLGKGVPFHLWPSVWADWPGKNSAGQVWQECFHWADGNHDGLVVESELEQCFLLSRTHDTVENFCASLCGKFPNEDALWTAWANGAETLVAGRWDSLWDSADKAVNSAHSFRYLDKDGNGGVTKTEFKSCYSVGNCGQSLPLIGNILRGAGVSTNLGINMADSEIQQNQHFDSKAKQQAAPSQEQQSPPRPLAHKKALATDTTDPGGSVPSSGDIPVWVLPVAALILLCLGVLCALAFAPFFFRGKKKATVSLISEEANEEAELEHNRAYSDLGLIDSPVGTPLIVPANASQAQSSQVAPSSPLIPMMMPPSFPAAPVQRQLNHPFTSVAQVPQTFSGAGFVPHPQLGRAPAARNQTR